VSAEDCVLFKLLYGRTKDIADLERIFAVRGDRLDFSYVESWVDVLFPEDDARRTVYTTLRERVTST
jgi:hypothetical protein